MNAKKYEIIDHTADIGIRVYGTDPGDLYVNAALGMFSLVTDIQNVAEAETEFLVVEGADWPDLMVNWLKELLYLWNARQWLARSVTIDSIQAQCIAAGVRGEAFDPERHAVRMEIKAVTYHQIAVTQQLTGWTARIIFDV